MSVMMPEMIFAVKRLLAVALIVTLSSVSAHAQEAEAVARGMVELGVPQHCYAGG